MIDIIYRMLGRTKKNEAILEDKNKEAHEIKHKMNVHILRIQKKVDRINVQTSRKLQEVSDDLQSVTYNIAVATGGRRRGLK